MATSRIPFVDNLRSLAIILVVTMHAAVTYSNFGRWYWMEPAPTGQLTLLFFAMYQSFLQAWFMGFLFLLAGYFAAPSFDRKGPRKFLVERAVRLGVPSLLYALLIQPFIVWFMLPLFRDGHVDSFSRSWYRYLVRWRFLDGTGPMWFAVALLIFSFAYVGVRFALRSTQYRGKPDHTAVVMLILAISACTFLVRVVQPLGTAVLNMQLGYFSQYIILFTVGVAAGRGNWLMEIPRQFALRWFTIASIGGVALWLAIILGGDALSYKDLSAFNGGWHWQSAAMSFWESFYCVGTCLGLTVLFREKFNTRGRVAKFLSDNAFAVYVFHPPLLIAITMAFHSVAAPAIVRFALASALAIAVSYLASALVFRRIPLLRSVL